MEATLSRIIEPRCRSGRRQERWSRLLLLARKTAVCGFRRDAPHCPVGRTARALVPQAVGSPGRAGSRLSCCRWSPTSGSVIGGILRSCAAGSPRAMTHRAHPTTCRPSWPPCASSGRRSARRRPRCGRLRSRPSRPRLGTRLSCGRISPLGHSLGQTPPYWAVSGASRDICGLSNLLDLQVFRWPDGRRTPCFTRERSQVRNPPRP